MRDTVNAMCLENRFLMMILQPASTQPRRDTKGNSKLINSKLSTDAPPTGTSVGVTADFPVKIVRMQSRANQKGRRTQL